MKTLTAYFSASGITKRAANALSDITNTDLFEIKPTVAYTSSDLDWTNKKSRSSIEMNDKSFRPEISEKLDNFNDYDTVFLCFPIWWYVAPTIINTFLESYDFSNKTVVLFATSGGSNFGNTVLELKKSVDSSTSIVEGIMLNGKINNEEIKKIVDSL